MTRAAASVTNYEQLDPDVRLMLRVRDADDACAFEALVTRYQDRLLTVLQHWSGNREWAEDLTQDVFLRVFRARARYVPQAKFSTWLYTIAHNVAANARRTRARRREVEAPNHSTMSSSIKPLEQLAAAASGQMPTRLAARQEMAEMVRCAISGLNDRQRLAVLLSKFEHMSYEEIAQAMDLSPSAVKSLLSRARGRLKELLEPYFADGRLPTWDTSDASPSCNATNG